MNKKLLLFVTLIAGLAGFLLRGFLKPEHASSRAASQAAAESETWTCAMHPNIQQPGPGKCPICGMDLTRVSRSQSGAATHAHVSLSPRARQLAQLRTARVTRDFAVRTVRLFGTIDVAESKLASITARVPGRIDRLYVDYTGVPVQKGDHLVWLYSPELLAAQQELIQARKTVDELSQNNADPALIDRVQTTAAAAGEKLRLWGLTTNQIQTIEQNEQPDDHLTIYSPLSGVVVQKHAVEGSYVQTGERIYSIADLSEVWVNLDAYESDLVWLHYGQDVEFETQAQPGRVFHGQIAFISPVLDSATRTVKVRVNVPNPDGLLKPQMFVRARVQARMASSGKLMDPALAGKWISPMHPEIVKEQPGLCDICGMDLVSAESLGYLSADEAGRQAPLLVPVSAPLLTGKRALVYVATPNQDGIYEPREVVLGPRTDNFYIVEQGLAEGEEVVVNGAFKIDSEVQIQAGPSMMAPEAADRGSAPPSKHGHTLISIQDDAAPLPEGLLENYLHLQTALAGDNLEQARSAAADLLDAAASIEAESTRSFWAGAAKRIQEAGQMEEARRAFLDLSNAFIDGFRNGDWSPAEPLQLAFCPMAFKNQGAHWLQRSNQIANPYYGEAMLRCGRIEQALPPPPASNAGGHHNHTH